MKEGLLYTSSVEKGKIRVLITDPVDEYMVTTLSELGLRVDYRPEISRGEILRIIGNYDVIVVRSRTKVDVEIMKAASKLRVIARAGIGVDNIDFEEATKRGIKIVYAPGASTASAAELTIGLMIAAARRLHEAIQSAKRGEFVKITGVELSDKVLGVIGFGRIGTHVARVALAMGMRVIAYDITDVRERAAALGVEVVDLDRLLRSSDVISLHVTVSKKSKPLFGNEEFEKVKPGLILVNTSRAAAIDGKALLKALNSGRVGFYATDVMWNEPPKEDWELEILNHERVIVSPHIGAQTREAQYRIAIQTTQNLLQAIREVYEK